MACRRLKKRLKGELIGDLVGVACLTVLMLAAMSVNNWITSQRAASRASTYLACHHLDCMERLRQEARISDNELLRYYNVGQFNTSKAETTVECVPFEIDGVDGYVVTMSSRMDDTGYEMTSKYVLTVTEHETFEPEVNPE